MTSQVVVVIDPDHHRDLIDRRIFGSFVEHMGRCVYTGIFEPEHPTADTNGFRGDAAELVRDLGVTLVRYPGGNFVSGYDWTDGIGPRDQRPRRLDLAWRSIETNQVGTDDFLAWTRALGVQPMLAVNLGTRGVAEAAALVEYCNLPGGTEWSEARRRNGAASPHEVKLWCLGNEMDGPWQLGHTSADRYADLVVETAQAMRRVDPAIELVACGSSAHDMPTFGSWESTVLDRAGRHIDYMSMHAYYEEHDGDRDSFLASGADMDAFIEGVAATIDAVTARRGGTHVVGISFDEWNVWYQSRFEGTDHLPVQVVPALIEDVYSMVDAVVVFLTNRLAATCEVEVRHGAFEQWQTVSAGHIAADDHGPRHRADAADIALRTVATHGSEDGRSTHLTLPSRSWTLVRARSGTLA